MATTTENLGMTLPDTTDPVDVTVLNGNFSAIDTFAGTQTAKDTEQDAAIAKLVDAGTKNLLKITGTSQTIRNVTFTVNDDGTVSVNGKNNTTSTAVFYLNVLPADTAPNYNGCKLTGCPQGGSTSTYRLGFQLNSGSFTSYASDTGDGSTIQNVPSAECRVVITVYPEATVDNLTFKPMICTAEDYAASDAFVPYVPSMLELYQMIQALQTGGTT